MTQTSAATITDPTAAEAFLARWTTAWNDHDGDAVAALCAEDLIYDEPALGDTVYGRDSIRDFVTGMATAFPDYRFTRVGLYIEVRRPALVVAWTMTGTLADTSRTLLMHGDDRLEFGEDGLIRAYRCLYDHKLVRRVLRGDAT